METGYMDNIVTLAVKFAVFCLLCLPLQEGHTAPTGSDLLYACSLSKESGFDSIEGKMCAWYVTPCNCGTDKDIPAVCLPEDVNVDELAELVIQGLSTRENLLTESAAGSAAIILSENFPCTE